MGPPHVSKRSMLLDEAVTKMHGTHTYPRAWPLYTLDASVMGDEPVHNPPRTVWSKMKVAIEIAMNHDYPIRLGAAIFKADRLIGVGHPKERPSNLQSWTNIIHSYKDTLHAEVVAILDSHPSRLKGSSIFIGRLRHSNGAGSPLEPGKARPCDVCLGLIERVGIREVYYTVNSKAVDKELGKITFQ